MHLNQYLEVLRLIADPEAQRAYERDVPIANVPAELACMWFDDLDADGPSDNLAPSDASRMKAFTAFYGSRVDDLPTDGGVAALHSSAVWREIMTEAQATLDDLGGGTSNRPMQTDGPSGRR